LEVFIVVLDVLIIALVLWSDVRSKESGAAPGDGVNNGTTGSRTPASSSLRPEPEERKRYPLLWQ
jgi:hypothetical protein